jgi:hypothetical protein
MEGLNLDGSILREHEEVNENVWEGREDRGVHLQRVTIGFLFDLKTSD